MRAREPCKYKCEEINNYIICLLKINNRDHSRCTYFHGKASPWRTRSHRFVNIDCKSSSPKPIGAGEDHQEPIPTGGERKDTRLRSPPGNDVVEHPRLVGEEPTTTRGTGSAGANGGSPAGASATAERARRASEGPITPPDRSPEQESFPNFSSACIPMRKLNSKKKI
jgi:hypothetical protein